MSEADGQNIGDLLSARSFAEYRAMFSISEAELRMRILDCPGGGSSFTATACSSGTDAVAVDPVYVADPPTIAKRIMTEVERGSTWTQANADRYVWDFYGDSEGHARMRSESARIFADLPELPGAWLSSLAFNRSRR
jgi:hypothetical protein